MGEKIEGEIATGLSGIVRGIFLDYLNLPFWFKTRFSGGLKKTPKEYYDVDVLWRDVLGPSYGAYMPKLKAPLVKVGDSVTLNEVDVTNFVPRAIGKFYATGFPLYQKYFVRANYPIIPERYRTNFTINMELAGAIAKSAVGIHQSPTWIYPIRTHKNPVWTVGFLTKLRHVVVNVNARTGSARIYYDSSKLNERFLNSLVSSKLSCQSGFAGVVRFKKHANRYLLTAISLTLGGSRTTEIGFPLILTSRAYAKIRSTIETYGSVFLENITGIVEEIPNEMLMSRKESPVLEWASDIPRVGLRVDSRLLLKHPGTPNVATAHSWTAVNWKGSPYYLNMPFRIGVQEFEYKIKESVDMIKLALNTLGTQPLFDFDERTPRFSEAKFGPNYFLKRVGVL